METTSFIVFLITFILGVIVAYFIGHKIGVLRRDKFWEAEIPEHRKDAIERSRAILTGHFSEQLAPYLPNFKYSPTECKFLGKPVDFLVFKGLDQKNVEGVVFVEVKSGNSKLSANEKGLKEAIEKKKVRWEEYRFDGKLDRK